MILVKRHRGRSSLAPQLLSILPSASYPLMVLGSSFVNSSGVCGRAPDVRGAGFPAFSATGTARFAYSVDAKGDPIITSNGSTGLMQTGAFTLTEPCAIFLVVRQDVWSSVNMYMLDGLTTNTGSVSTRVSTPTIGLYAGSVAALNSDLAVGAFAVLSIEWNGVSSSIKVNEGTATTGNAGNAVVMGGMTIGAAPNASAYSQNSYKHIIATTGIPTAAQKTAIRQALGKAGHVTAYA